VSVRCLCLVCGDEWIVDEVGDDGPTHRFAQPCPNGDSRLVPVERHAVDVADDGDGLARAECSCGWHSGWRDRDTVADMAAEHRRLWSAASDGHPLAASGRDPRDPMNPWPP
jgi:hypothetical protein